MLLSVSIFDDDTGDPVNIADCATASGFAFTGTHWTVTDGAISTTSTTSITIPVFPIGNQLSALALTVGAGLGIKGGDAVQIVDQGNARNFMIGTVTSYSPNGALVCQIGSTFQFEIRRGAPRNDGSGYVPWYDFGTPNEIAPLIKAALGTGVTIVDLGYLQVLVPESTFRQLAIGTFNASLTMFDGVATRQVFIAHLPVWYGGVTT
jgi:hypothetical protein